MQSWSRNPDKMSGGFQHVGKEYEIQISLVDKARRPDFDSEPVEDREGQPQLRVSERFLYVDAGI